MKWWTGWPVTQVRAALATMGAVEVELGNRYRICPTG